MKNSCEEWMGNLSSLLKNYPKDNAFLEETIRGFFGNDQLFALFKKSYRESFVGAVK